MTNTITVAPVAGPISCRSIAVYTRGPGWQAAPHALAGSHLVVYVSRGGGRVDINGQVRGFGSNSAIFLPAGTIHAFDFSPTTIGWVIQVEGGTNAPFRFPEDPLCQIIPERRTQAQLVHICEEVTDEHRTGDKISLTALHCLAGLLSVWIGRNLSARIEQNAEATGRTLLRRFTEAVERKLSAQYGVPDYAEMLGVSAAHLTRVCQEFGGKPARQMIQDRVLLEARSRLSDGQSHIAQIAEDLGFGSVDYFTKIFSQKIGVTPEAFQRHHKRDARSDRAM